MGMPRAHAAETSEQRTPGEIKVSEGVEELVAHELVGVAQAADVQDVLAADDHGVVERSAARQAGGPQPVELVKQPECARAAELRLERVRIEDQTNVLPANQ